MPRPDRSDGRRDHATHGPRPNWCIGASSVSDFRPAPQYGSAVQSEERWWALTARSQCPLAGPLTDTPCCSVGSATFDLVSYAFAVTYFAKYRTPAIGFDTIAGRDNGLRRIVLAAGQLGASEGGPLHLHHGEEILHILSGEVEVTVGSEIRRCLAGDVVIIPTDTPIDSPQSPKPKWKSWSSSTRGKSSQSRTRMAQLASWRSTAQTGRGAGSRRRALTGPPTKR